MPSQDENIPLIDKIIDEVSGLPLEYQDRLLAIAKGMAFTKDCLCKKIDCETNKQKTA